MCAEIYSYMHFKKPLRKGAWEQQDDTNVWSLAHNAKDRVRKDEYPALEWDRVDYNSFLFIEFPDYSSLHLDCP
jgi:hypothetical protein